MLERQIRHRTRGSELRGMLCLALVLSSFFCGLAIAQPVAPQRTPSVEILSPQEGAAVSQPNLALKLRITAPSEKPLLVRVLVDGLEVFRTRDLILSGSGRPSATPGAAESREDGVQRIEVAIPPRDCVLGVMAETEDQKSPIQERRLRWVPGTSPAPPAILKPKLYVLAIGISQYASPELRLQFPAKDAADFTAAMTRQQGHLYQSVQSRVLVDDQATKGNILDGLEWLQRQATQHDLTVLFIAGHGINNPTTGGYAFLPYDADLNAIKRTLVADSDIRSTLSNLPGKALLFMDTCHAGNVLGPVRLRAAFDYAALMQELTSADSGVIVFASSTGRQSSRESERWNNGAFTKALVEGLRGRADFQRSGRITVNMLDLYISERVKELTGGLQTPSTAKPSTVSDYPIAIVLPSDVTAAERDESEPPPAPLVSASPKPPTVPATVPVPPPSAQLLRKESRPLHKRWWFWTALAGSAAVAATAVALGVSLRPMEPQAPDGVSVFDRSF